MKGFRKLSSIAMLLFAFVYPPSLAEAKESSLSNSLNEQSIGAEVNLVEGSTGEFLIAQRQYQRQRIRQRQIRQKRIRQRQFSRQQLRRQFRRQQLRRQFRRQQLRREQFRRQQLRREQFRRQQFRREQYR